MPFAGLKSKSPSGKGLTPCRDCGQPISLDAVICPHCGAPRPWQKDFRGYGFEYKSETIVFGMPLVHVSFLYKNFLPRPARGVIAIGQIAFGIVSIGQFGMGVFCLAQFALAGMAVCQIGLAVRALGQIIAVLDQGIGQIVIHLGAQ